MVTLGVILKQSGQLDDERSIAEKRKKIDEECEQKERATVKRRKQLNGERAAVEKSNEIDEERAIVKKRKQLESNEIDDEEEEEEQKERGIVKKRKQHGSRAIVIFRNENDEEKSIVICRNEIDDDEEQNMKERVIMKLFKKFDEEERLAGEATLCKDLPEQLIQGILKRLPARELINCSCMSKFWHNLVFNDPKFATSHFVQNQNKFSLFFDLYNVCVDNTKKAFYFRVVEEGNIMLDVSCMTALNLPGTTETVGHCNGLTCIKRVKNRHHKQGALIVINPIRAEQFGLLYATPTGYIYLCSGFGFDPSSQEYKVVVIFTKETNDGFVCMVFTLGSNSWRKITTALDEMSPPPGSPPFPSGMVTRVSSRPPTLCGSDLLWRATNKVHNSSRIEMLLSFDLHSEKIQFIRFPTECTLTPPAAMNEHHNLVVDQLLEFKGYPCIARSEKIIVSNSDHSGHRCVDRSSFCCCCCKLHLYILKDKVKQVWIKEETFDVQIKDQEVLLGPFCCYFGTTTSTTPPPRVLTFSDQVILSWFNGDCLITYNLRNKFLDVVEVSRSRSGFFQTKMNPSGLCIGDDNIYPRDMDYQLRVQVENLVSLKTFIPEGAETSEFNSFNDLKRAIDDDPPAGYVMTGRNSVNIYTFG